MATPSPATPASTASSRLEVTKTYKLFIDGKFPRSESGRSLAVNRADGSVFAHLCHASRKDLRDAASAARKAMPGWSGATAYLRGQILYRIAEMMEGKRAEFAEAIAVTTPATTGKAKKPGPGALSPEQEVTLAIDRMVAFAGWADKYAQVLGCNNAVAGPYYNFTVPEPTGVIALIPPSATPSLLGLISLLAPAICAGNTAITLASESNPVPAAILGEVIATSDVPAGVVNILTGPHAELIPIIASHRDIDAVLAANPSDDHHRILREGAAENLKRITLRTLAPADWANTTLCHSPQWIEPLVEMKTIWHPSAV